MFLIDFVKDITARISILFTYYLVEKYLFKLKKKGIRTKTMIVVLVPPRFIETGIAFFYRVIMAFNE